MKKLLIGSATVLLILGIGLTFVTLLSRWEVRRLAAQLDDSDEVKRMEAASSLGKMGPKAASAVPALIRTLKSRKPLTKPYSGGSLTFGDQAPEQAREALIHIGPAAAPALTGALADSDALTRVNAAWSLWAITKETDDALPVLLEAWRDRALDSQDDCIRIDATAAIGEIAGEYPDLLLPILMKALAEDAELGYGVTQALTAMARKDDRFVAKLFGLMATDGEHLYRFAAFGLRELNSGSVPLLIGGLKSHNAELRSRCAWALGGMKSTYAASAIPSLRACQRDGNEEVRKWSTWALECIEKRAFDGRFD